MYIKNPLVLDKIQAAMNLLFDLKEEFDDYLDKSLFFQDTRVIEGWLLLAGEIKEIEIEDGEERDEKWEQRSEPYAASLLARRDLFIKYKGLYRAYYDPLYNLWMNYSIDGECISADAAEALKADHYEKILEVEDFDQYLEEVNSRSLDARYFANKTLTYILHILQAIMDKAGQTVIDLKPSDEDFAKAIDDDLRGWTRAFGKEVLRDMKEYLLRRFKKRITDDNRYELWCEMLRSDEDAIKMAMRQKLATYNDETQDHWGDDRKEQMDHNDNLMRLIYSSCYTEELFDLGNVENVHPFIAQLTLGNLDMFYDIIVRRSLIQCEMFPELKSQHEEWLNRSNEQPEEVEETGMSKARQSKLDEIIRIMQNGNWKLPATAENIKKLLNTIFGRDLSLLENGDELLCEKMWDLVEKGGGDRMVIVPANLAGFFKEENLLQGSPLVISNALFGKDKNQVNNINKGKGTPSNCSNAFIAVIPFIRKYIDKVIRQV